MLYKQGKISLYYEKKGKKKNSIIILPGWGDTRNTFLFLIENLKEYFTVYCIDYPNFGKSSPLLEEWTIYDYASLIKNFIQENNLENSIVIAHSFGGRIISILEGKENLKFKKIILIDVAGIRRKSLKRYLKGKLYKLLKKITIFLKRKDLEKKLENFFSSQDYKDLPIAMKKTFQNIIKEDLRKYYKRIESETLILWGEKDEDTPIKDAYTLRKIIKNSGLIVFKNAHHFSYLEKQKEVLCILLEYLKKDMD